MRPILATLILLLALAGGYAFASPYWALDSLRAAIDAGDVEGLERRVDFPVLRENLRTQLNQMLASELGEAAEEGPFAAIATGMATAMIDPVLETVVTPAGIARMVAGQQFMAEPVPPSGAPAPASQTLFEGARVERETFDLVSVWVPNESGERVRVVLQRYGVTWKLTNIVFPSASS